MKRNLRGTKDVKMETPTVSISGAVSKETAKLKPGNRKALEKENMPKNPISEKRIPNRKKAVKPLQETNTAVAATKRGKRINAAKTTAGAESKVTTRKRRLMSAENIEEIHSEKSDNKQQQIPAFVSSRGKKVHQTKSRSTKPLSASTTSSANTPKKENNESETTIEKLTSGNVMLRRKLSAITASANIPKKENNESKITTEILTPSNMTRRNLKRTGSVKDKIFSKQTSTPIVESTLVSQRKNRRNVNQDPEKPTTSVIETTNTRDVENVFKLSKKKQTQTKIPVVSAVTTRRMAAVNSVKNMTGNKTQNKKPITTKMTKNKATTAKEIKSTRGKTTISTGSLMSQLELKEKDSLVRSMTNRNRKVVKNQSQQVKNIFEQQELSENKDTFGKAVKQNFTITKTSNENEEKSVTKKLSNLWHSTPKVKEPSDGPKQPVYKKRARINGNEADNSVYDFIHISQENSSLVNDNRMKDVIDKLIREKKAVIKHKARKKEGRVTKAKTKVTRTRAKTAKIPHLLNTLLMALPLRNKKNSGRQEVVPPSKKEISGNFPNEYADGSNKYPIEQEHFVAPIIPSHSKCTQSPGRPLNTYQAIKKPIRQLFQSTPVRQAMHTVASPWRLDGKQNEFGLSNISPVKNDDISKFQKNTIQLFNQNRLQPLDTRHSTEDIQTSEKERDEKSRNLASEINDCFGFSNDDDDDDTQNDNTQLQPSAGLKLHGLVRANVPAIKSTSLKKSQQRLVNDASSKAKCIYKTPQKCRGRESLPVVNTSIMSTKSTSPKNSKQKLFAAASNEEVLKNSTSVNNNLSALFKYPQTTKVSISDKIRMMKEKEVSKKISNETKPTGKEISSNQRDITTKELKSNETQFLSTQVETDYDVPILFETNWPQRNDIQHRSYTRAHKRERRPDNKNIMTDNDCDTRDVTASRPAKKAKHNDDHKQTEELRKFEEEFNSQCKEIDNFELIMERSQ